MHDLRHVMPCNMQPQTSLTGLLPVCVMSIHRVLQLHSCQQTLTIMAGSSTAASCDAAHLDVAVQLSRFHLETLEGSGTGDVDIRGLTLTVAATGKELLLEAHVALRQGVRYGLIGRCVCMHCMHCMHTCLTLAYVHAHMLHTMPCTMRAELLQ